MSKQLENVISFSVIIFELTSWPGSCPFVGLGIGSKGNCGSSRLRKFAAQVILVFASRAGAKSKPRRLDWLIGDDDPPCFLSKLSGRVDL